MSINTYDQAELRRVHSTLLELVEFFDNPNRSPSLTYGKGTPGMTLRGLAEDLKEFIAPQEPCGGRCGEPDCNLDTWGQPLTDPHFDPLAQRPTKTEDILEEALRITSGDRQNAYGPADQDFKRTAAMWSALKGVEFTARDVALFMICLKCSRETHQRKRDNWVDIAGYARCGSKCTT